MGELPARRNEEWREWWSRARFVHELHLLDEPVISKDVRARISSVLRLRLQEEAVPLRIADVAMLPNAVHALRRLAERPESADDLPAIATALDVMSEVTVEVCRRYEPFHDPIHLMTFTESGEHNTAAVLQWILDKRDGILDDPHHSLPHPLSGRPVSLREYLLIESIDPTIENKGTRWSYSWAWRLRKGELDATVRRMGFEGVYATKHTVQHWVALGNDLQLGMEIRDRTLMYLRQMFEGRGLDLDKEYPRRPMPMFFTISSLFGRLRILADGEDVLATNLLNMTRQPLQIMEIDPRIKSGHRSMFIHARHLAVVPVGMMKGHIREVLRLGLVLDTPGHRFPWAVDRLLDSRPWWTPALPIIPHFFRVPLNDAVDLSHRYALGNRHTLVDAFDVSEGEILSAIAHLTKSRGLPEAGEGLSGPAGPVM